MIDAAPAARNLPALLKGKLMTYIPESLTGNRRYRVNWRGKLILQVEQNVGFLSNGGNCVDIEPGTIWRDATATDVTVENR